MFEIILLLVLLIPGIRALRAIKRKLDDLAQKQRATIERIAELEGRVSGAERGLSRLRHPTGETALQARAAAEAPAGAPEESLLEIPEGIIASHEAPDGQEEASAAALRAVAEEVREDVSAEQAAEAQAPAGEKQPLGLPTPEPMGGGPEIPAVFPPSAPAAAGAGRAFRSAGRAVRRLLGVDEATDWEMLVGGRWLNLIGIVVLVIGIVLLTQQALFYLGPRGKIGLGAGFSLALLVGGILLDHRSAYRRIGRTLIGGGWALLYFDAFAASNVEQARVIFDPVFGLVALALVAAGMVAHSLRYRSQFITSAAFGLGYLAIILTPVTLASLVASALLAAALALVAWAMSWQYMLSAGVIAAYSNHWLWQQKVYEAKATMTTPPVLTQDQGFWLSAAVIVFYWAIFAVVSLSRRLDAARDRRLHLTISVANAVGMLGLIALQLTQGYGGHHLCYLTAPASLGYVLVARGERRLGDRLPFLFAATLAVVLYAATLPLARFDYDIDARWIALVLTPGALLAMWAGLRAHEFLLRLEGYLLAAIAFALVIGVNLARPGAATVNAVWFVAPTLASAFHSAAEWWSLETPRSGSSAEFRAGARAFGSAAALIVAYVLWNQAPRDTVGPAWLGAALVLLEASFVAGSSALRIEAYVLQALAFIGLLGVNLNPSVVIEHPTAPRWILVGACTGAFYFAAWRLLGGVWEKSRSERRLGVAPSDLATILVVLLAWVELDRTLFTAAMSLWAVALVEAGFFSRQENIRLQGYALVFIGFAAAVFLNGLPPPAGTGAGFHAWGPAAVTIALLWWQYWRLGRRPAAPDAADFYFGDGCSAAATILIAEILWKELPWDVFGLAWHGAGLVMFEISALTGRAVLRVEGYVLQSLAFAASLYVIANAAFRAPQTSASLWALMTPAIAGYYFLAWRLLAGRWAATALERSLGWLPSLLATVLVALLVCLKVDRPFVTAALSLWGVLVFEVGLFARRQPIRLQGQGLVALGFVAALLMNVLGYAFDGRVVPISGPAAWAPALVTTGALSRLYYRLSLGSADSSGLEFRLGELASGAATLLAALILWKELPALAVALGWGALGLALFELSISARAPILRAQAHLLLGAAFVRLFMANLLINAAFAGLSLRVASCAPILMALYYVQIRLREIDAAADETGFLGRVLHAERKAGVALYSYAGFLLLAVLCRFEFGRAHTVAAWSALILVFLTLGVRRDRRDFRFQSYILAIYSVFRAWSTNVYLDGYWLGAPERISTTLPMIAALFVAAVAIARPWPGAASGGTSRLIRLLDWLDGRAHALYAVLASLFVSILIFYQLSINTVSIGWAMQGFSLLALGFVLNDRVFRLFGLGLLFICLLKVAFLDLAGVQTIYRTMSFVLLGLILLLASLGYARYRDKIGKFI